MDESTATDMIFSQEGRDMIGHSTAVCNGDGHMDKYLVLSKKIEKCLCGHTIATSILALSYLLSKGALFYLKAKERDNIWSRKN